MKAVVPSMRRTGVGWGPAPFLFENAGDLAGGLMRKQTNIE